LKTADFDYELPTEFIAQTPLEPRDSSRLLVLDRASGSLEHAHFNELQGYLRAGDVLVMNETKVIPARLSVRKVPTGGRVELLLLRRLDEFTWETLAGGKGLSPGTRLQVENGPPAEIIADLGGPKRMVRFAEPLEPVLSQAGRVPLPPYIHTDLADPERYQTVFARWPGSAAAPTAGLHFTPQLIDRLHAGGIDFVYVTLHIGLDTFAPVTEEKPELHKIHTEWCQLTTVSAEVINRASERGDRVIAVGTTSVRTLESAARLAGKGQRVSAFEGATDLFILPKFNFRAVDAIITNFHLPRSTLIMLVSAFAGRERILAAYEVAKQQGYRFYSFGDAMLIL